MPNPFVQVHLGYGLVHGLQICPVNSTSHRLNFKSDAIFQLTPGLPSRSEVSNYHQAI
jgi:hypothetical protein